MRAGQEFAGAWSGIITEPDTEYIFTTTLDRTLCLQREDARRAEGFFTGSTVASRNQIGTEGR